MNDCFVDGFLCEREGEKQINNALKGRAPIWDLQTVVHSWFVRDSPERPQVNYKDHEIFEKVYLKAVF